MKDVLKPYPAYKDSGVPWLGEVPEHWEPSRLDRLFTLRSEEPAESDLRVTGYLDGRVTLRSNVISQKIKGVVKEAGWQRVYPGDFAISGMNAHLGGMGVSDSLGKCSPIYLVLKPKDGTNAQFVSHTVRHAAFSGALKALVNTIRYNSADFKREDLKRILFYLPPPPEQNAIVRYLDSMGRRIRRYINAKKKLIALLNEQKQAIIHQAVTRGLDPNVRLKPSGVDWLGDIPEHWEGLPLKRWVTTKITDGPHETPTLLDEGIPFMSAESMINGKLDFEHRRGFISHSAHEHFCQKCRPQLDDIFMCKSGATTGKVAIVDTDQEFSVWSPLALVRVSLTKVIPKLMFYVLQASYVQQQVQTTWSAGTQPNLSMAAMERLFVVLPPITEQEMILENIERQISSIDSMSETIQREIDTIREYRTSLIADVVTGKLDVREAAAGLPEGAEEESFEETELLSEKGDVMENGEEALSGVPDDD